MYFINENFSIIIGIVLLLLAYFGVRMIGTPASRNRQRTDYIKNKINSIGGNVEEIIKMKKSECPYNDELGLNSESVYIPYWFKYRIDNQTKEGWAILFISSTLINPIVTENNWLMKL